MFYNEVFLRLENRLPPKEQYIFEKILLLKLKLYRGVIWLRKTKKNRFVVSCLNKIKCSKIRSEIKVLLNLTLKNNGAPWQ